MTLSISQALCFWLTVEGFFLSVVVECPVAKGLNSCQKGRGCWREICSWLRFFCHPKSPLVHSEPVNQNLDQHAPFVYSQLSFFFVLDLSYNFPHLTEPVESSQNLSHILFYCAKRRMMKSSAPFGPVDKDKPLQCCFKAVCSFCDASIAQHHFQHACQQMFSSTEVRQRTDALQLSFK